MRLGLLNIYWFGLLQPHDPLNVGFYHDASDDERIRSLLESLDVSVLTLIEIVDIARVEQIVESLPGHWRVRDAAGAALCSSDSTATPDNVQRVVLAWNDDDVELVRWSRPLQSGPRVPIVARFRSRTTSEEWTHVGIHPKSGILRGWGALPPNAPDHVAGKRRQQLFDELGLWLSNPPADYAGNIVVCGDFNSVADSVEATSLRELPGWTWPTPLFSPPSAEPRTTRTDPEIIDHFVLSPGLSFANHEVLAFDIIATYPNAAPISSKVWKRTTDHRPVRIRLVF